MHKESLELLQQIQQVIEAYDFALTLRQIYYQLVARQIIANEQNNYRKISRLCVQGRDEGMLPEDAFADRLREVDKPSSWDNLNAFMKTVRVAYRKSKWNDQATYVEVWTEKDALRGVISPITHDYDVPLLVVRGQVSRTAIYESYNRFAERVEEGKLCYLFYFGDFDPSGISIFNSLVERMRKFGDCGEAINFQRIALTREQIDTYALPQDPAKSSDPNYKKFVSEYGDNVVELDALPPGVLRELIKHSIESRIDMVILAQVQQTEEEEKTQLQHFISQIAI